MRDGEVREKETKIKQEWGGGNGKKNKWNQETSLAELRWAAIKSIRLRIIKATSSKGFAQAAINAVVPSRLIAFKCNEVKRGWVNKEEVICRRRSPLLLTEPTASVLALALLAVLAPELPIVTDFATVLVLVLELLTLLLLLLLLLQVNIVGADGRFREGVEMAGLVLLQLRVHRKINAVQPSYKKDQQPEKQMKRKWLSEAAEMAKQK